MYQSTVVFPHRSVHSFIGLFGTKCIFLGSVQPHGFEVDVGFVSPAEHADSIRNSNPST